MKTPVDFERVGRIAEAGDNVAIATRDLPAGAVVQFGDMTFALDHSVLEGHRFAIAPIPAGQALRSWGLPFGYARHAIAPGAYLCNESTRKTLAARGLSLDLPAAANFDDRIAGYALDEAAFRPAPALPRMDPPRTFAGYGRGGERGVGTRNMIVLLGTSSRTGGFVRQLAERVQDLAATHAAIDGIVPVAHTEGATAHPHNRELVLRTLAGFMVHPNVGAVLAVDVGTEAINNGELAAFMRQNGYPLDAVRHAFLSMTDSFQATLTQAETIVRGWAGEVAAEQRSPQPLSALKIALQCGGSDAFSGISGNPLASWVAREIIRNGGAANLAETDELIGAEPYMLQRVRDLETARAFLATIERFKAWAERHGASAEGNPSGGNKLRGLYNITLKSIGAARKRHPDVRLDYVIDYSQPMDAPGFYFMDSPGNDLESIAGQVAAGCNVIAFVTGNGSITNFPFVPTIKIVTTTARFDQLAADMDVNAGAYLDGAEMDALGAETFELTLAIASGRASVGELAGHAQVQLWRNWPGGEGPGDDAESAVGGAPSPRGEGLTAAERDRLHAGVDALLAIPLPARDSRPRLGLIAPTSLCSGQIAQIAARRVNGAGIGGDHGIDRFVALVHTEGCGASDYASELSRATLLAYLRHPAVARALLLEHGCEKTHNDDFRNGMVSMQMDPDQFGWVSIQGDGGIAGALEKTEAWFRQPAGAQSAGQLARLWTRRIALCSRGEMTDDVQYALATVAGAFVRAGGAVVVPTGDRLIDAPWLRDLAVDEPPTLAYAESSARPGLQSMDAPTDHWVEIATGLVATGVEAVLVWVGDEPVQGHPFAPLLQIGAPDGLHTGRRADLDLALDEPAERWPSQIAGLLDRALAGEYEPAAMRQQNIDFQITRGRLGISL